MPPPFLVAASARLYTVALALEADPYFDVIRIM
jgi:hypothetical protein